MRVHVKTEKPTRNNNNTPAQHQPFDGDDYFPTAAAALSKNIVHICTRMRDQAQISSGGFRVQTKTVNPEQITISLKFIFYF
jgi:hypothetical protein